MARLTNQIVFVCAFLTNFLPDLVPPPKILNEDEVDDYLTDFEDDSDSSDDADSD